MNVILILCDTLRRDHCGPYNQGRPLDECGSPQAPHWTVPTPNIDHLAARGTVFDQCYCGSTPCMPARRDIFTGRFEFLWRGWGPLEEDDLDLPRQVSGQPNKSIAWMKQNNLPVSYLVTDHFHLWEQGSGNYHMGFTGFEFIRGKEADAWRTDPVDFPCPPQERLTKNERHWRNAYFLRGGEEDWSSPKVFAKAAEWLDANHTHENFFLHVDCFDPHEPLDPPEELVKMFDPEGYSRFPAANWPYDRWEGKMSPEAFQNARARYAANVVLADRALGKLVDAMDRLDLWKNTLVIFTTDHGTFNGDHGRMGKLQTHEFAACGHIPFIVAHPGGRGERRNQLVQLVDIYPTALAAVGRPCPTGIHGMNLLPALSDPATITRDLAIMGQFGQSVSITDGRWTLHQAPVPDNQPLNWYGACLSKFLPCDLGPYNGQYRQVLPGSHANRYCWQTPTWLSDRHTDPSELTNLAAEEPAELARMQRALAETIQRLGAPPEQLVRLGLKS